MINKEYVGSSFDSWLKEEEIYKEVIQMTEKRFENVNGELVYTDIKEEDRIEELRQILLKEQKDLTQGCDNLNLVFKLLSGYDVLIDKRKKKADHDRVVLVLKLICTELYDRLLAESKIEIKKES